MLQKIQVAKQDLSILADLKGRNYLKGFVNMAEANVNVDSLIVLDRTLTNGQSDDNHIDVDFGMWNTEANFLHETNGNVYGNPGFIYGSANFFYHSFGSNVVAQVNRKDVTPRPGIVGYKSRLGGQRWNDTTKQWEPPFNHSLGTPAFTYISGEVIPPPTGCTWVLGTPGNWTSCVNGSQTRTTPYISSVVGCVPTTVKPPDLVETRQCTISSPVFTTTFSGTGPNLVATVGSNISPGISWSLGSFLNGSITTNNNTHYPWRAGSASRVVFKGITFKSAPAANVWPRITAEHVIQPDGKILHGNTFTGITIQKDVRYATLELPCPEGGKLTSVIGGPLNTGSTVTMTIESMEVYP